MNGRYQVEAKIINAYVDIIKVDFKACHIFSQINVIVLKKIFYCKKVEDILKMINLTLILLSSIQK